jgi:hypothetical protein
MIFNVLQFENFILHLLVGVTEHNNNARAATVHYSFCSLESCT